MLTPTRRRPIFLFFISLCVCIATISWGLESPAQLLSWRENTPASAQVLSADVTRYGALEVTWVTSPLNEKKLFQIASHTVLDRSSTDKSQLPVEVRAKSIEDLVWLEIARFRENAVKQLSGNSSESSAGNANSVDPQSAQVIISTLNNATVIQVTDDNDSRPLTLATVTDSDTNFYSQTTAEVARQWQEVLQTEITQARELYSPKTMLNRVKQAAIALLGVILCSGVLTLLHRHLGKRQRTLQARIRAETEDSKLAQVPTSPADSPVVRRSERLKGRSPFQHKLAQTGQIARLLKRQLNANRRIELYKFVQWLLVWLAVLTWYLGIYYLTTRLPSLMRWSNQVLIQPLNLMAIWFLISLTMRLSNAAIQHSVNAWKETSYLAFGDVQRKAFRSTTIAGALQGMVTCILLFLGIVLTLTQLGLPVSSFLAGSALVGLALSFGAQSLVKDVVNGCLILLEDQFAVGDVITANGESGLVEKLNLRLTQLRNEDGELISIPNSAISLVKNQTNSWSRVNMAINVPYDANLDGAIAIVQETATDMSQSTQWQSAILEPPEMLGVDSFNDNSVTIRLLIRTQPSEQWAVGREFRRLLKQAFDLEGISMRLPQMSVLLNGASYMANSES